MKKRFLSLLLLGACTAPQSVNADGLAGLQVGQPRPVAVPETYMEWLDTLPDPREAASKPFRAGFHGKIVIAFPHESMSMDIQLGGLIEYTDMRHFRESIDLHLDLGELSPELPDEPVAITFLVEADGETLFFEPRFHDDWLLEKVGSLDMGFETMTFTLDLDLLEQMFFVYWRFLQDSDIDLSTLLPEGITMEEFFTQGMNPVGWSRLYLLTADISNFRVDSTEVHITAKLKDEWVDIMMVPSDPQTMAMMEDFVYDICFDRYSGMPSSMSMVLSAEGLMQMDMSIEFVDFRIGDDLFPADHFRHDSTEGRTLFPVDAFIQMALGSMQGKMQDDDDDIPF